MKSTKKTVITFTTHEILVVRKTGFNTPPRWCSLCQASVEVFTPDEAALILDASPSFIFQKIAEGPIHALEETGNPLMVCSNSLLKDPNNSGLDSHIAPTLRLEE
jgi:hypothetical protein